MAAMHISHVWEVIWVWHKIWYFPKIRGPQYRPKNTIVLIIGTPEMVPLILGNPHLGSLTSSFCALVNHYSLRTRILRVAWRSSVKIYDEQYIGVILG